MNRAVLVVDDEPSICQSVVSALDRYEFEVAAVHNAEDAQSKLEDDEFDLLILDIGLPGQSGTDFCRALRRENDIPIIFLTGHDADMDRIVGLEIGADDYITKPFHPGVLLARARAVLRRSSRGAASEPEPTVEASEFRIVIDDARYDALVDAEYLDLTPTEFKLLKVLMNRPGRVYTREQLKAGAYGPGVFVSDKTINSHITRIRKKIEEYGFNPIDATRSIGYRIIVEQLRVEDGPE